LGAERVFAIDVLRERLALARRFGAEPLALQDDPSDAISAVREATGGRGADPVLEAVGSPEATRLAYELARPGGTLSAVGVHTETRFALAPGEIYDKNLTYHAGRAPARRYMERLLPLAEARAGDLAALVSHRLTLAEGPRGYDLFDRRLEGCTKVVLFPGGAE
ncbi:MAG TPA: zinc-binding dehydrogenase, partial [Thermoanaerobaculia bacterium]|nr:zinc-binding dehydrogenase [Thermoanaerobaculia bacterium]